MFLFAAQQVSEHSTVRKIKGEDMCFQTGILKLIYVLKEESGAMNNPQRGSQQGQL